MHRKVQATITWICIIPIWLYPGMTRITKTEPLNTLMATHRADGGRVIRSIHIIQLKTPTIITKVLALITTWF